MKSEVFFNDHQKAQIESNNRKGYFNILDRFNILFKNFQLAIQPITGVYNGILLTQL